MPTTQLRGQQVRDASIQRDDLDTTTPGEAVVRKLIPGTNITFTSTGVDAGTGDVTINAGNPTINAGNPIVTVFLTSPVDVNIANPGATIDGVILVTGDRILLPVQNDTAENGVYLFDTAATPLVRDPAFDTLSDFDGALIMATSGDTLVDRIYATQHDVGATEIGIDHIYCVPVNDPAPDYGMMIAASANYFWY